MILSTLESSNIDEIKQLFTDTLTDSEGLSEGTLIGNLVCEIMADTSDDDYCGLS